MSIYIIKHGIIITYKEHENYCSFKCPNYKRGSVSTPDWTMVSKYCNLFNRKLKERCFEDDEINHYNMTSTFRCEKCKNLTNSMKRD